MTKRADGREPEDLRPLKFTRDFTEMATGSVLVEMGRTKVICTASVEDRIPPLAAGQGAGLGDGRVLDAARLHPGPVRPGSGQGEALGPHPGDPAAHRPVTAGDLRPARPRRDPDHGRLRRHPGRRRHPHGVHLRRLRRPPRRLLPARGGQADRQPPAHRRCGGRLGRHRRRRGRCSTCPTSRTSRPRST